jgi:hypothetical protein
MEDKTSRGKQTLIALKTLLFQLLGPPKGVAKIHKRGIIKVGYELASAVWVNAGKRDTHP